MVLTAEDLVGDDDREVDIQDEITVFAQTR